MTKQNLQKELLEKVKEGVKPSDLKNLKRSKSEGDIPKAPPLPNQQVKALETQINSLQKQLQTYKDFKEADLKIKERYKKEIEDLKTSLNGLNNKNNEYKENIKELRAKIEEMDKTTSELKNKQESKGEVKETNIKTFFCDSCQLTKQGEYIKRKVDTPFEPRMHGRVCYLCSSCSPYVKEMSEVDFDKEDNPYKLE